MGTPSGEAGRGAFIPTCFYSIISMWVPTPFRTREKGSHPKHKSFSTHISLLKEKWIEGNHFPLHIPIVTVGFQIFQIL